MKFLDYYRKPLNIALQKSKRFSAYEPFIGIDRFGRKTSFYRQYAGEGWLLTAEMAQAAAQRHR